MRRLCTTNHGAQEGQIDAWSFRVFMGVALFMIDGDQEQPLET